MRKIVILFLALSSTLVSLAQTKNTMHFFVGRSLGQPSIVPLIIAKHQAKNPAGLEYDNINYGGTFRVANFADRTFEITTGFNFSKRTYLCYDMHLSLPSTNKYNIQYHGDYFYNEPRNVKMNFKTYFVPIAFNYNFAGHKKFFHQIGGEFQLGYRDFDFLIERESGNYTDNFGSLARREDVNALMIGKTIPFYPRSTSPNFAEDYGVLFGINRDPYDLPNQTPTLFDGKNTFYSLAFHYKCTYKVNEVLSVFGKTHIQRIVGDNSFMNQSMIYNVQFGISVMDAPLFKFIRRQVQLLKATKKRDHEN